MKEHEAIGEVRRSLGARRRRAPSQSRRARQRKRLFKRLKGISFSKILRFGQQRTGKWTELYRTAHPTTEKVPVFIVGCNRSGTNMVCEAIGRSPHGWDYRERAFGVAFNGYYLRSDRTVEWLIRRTPSPIVSFGSILDSQRVDNLLSRFDGSKAIWVYRKYEDVANSCGRMQWAYEMRDFARWVAHGELQKLGGRGERIGNDTIELFGELFREDLSNEECACLYWYMRNRLYFDLELEKDPRVLIVAYEDAALNAERAFRGIFDFLGFPFHPYITENVLTGSVGKHQRPAISPAIEELCAGLKRRLDAEFARVSSSVTGAQ